MKGMPPRVGGRCLRCARGSRLTGSLLARDVVGASSACTNEFHETGRSHALTHTATQPQATAHYRPQRTAHRREASGEGFTIRRASRVGGNPPPNSNACACSLCACGVQAAAQHINPGWVLFRSSGGFRLRWVSKSDAPLATGWVGSSALRSHLQPPATLLVTCLAHGFGQHPL